MANLLSRYWISEAYHIEGEKARKKWAGGIQCHPRALPWANSPAGLQPARGPAQFQPEEERRGRGETADKGTMRRGDKGKEKNGEAEKLGEEKDLPQRTQRKKRKDAEKAKRRSFPPCHPDERAAFDNPPQ
jgi:hypothetical protein